MQHEQLLRDSLYHLKFDYGTTIAVNHLISSEVNVYTGVKTQSTQRIVVHRAIKLPEMFNRETHQSISAISANKQLVMGGSVDIGTADFIIDGNDVSLPELTSDDWIDEGGYRYQINQVIDLEGYGWIIKARRLAGQRPEPIDVSASNTMTMGQEAEDA